MFPYFLPLLGGILIGLAAILLLGLNGRIAGISGITAGLLHPPSLANIRWRIAFLIGLILGPILTGLALGHSSIGQPITSTPVLAIAGLLVGFGTALGGGCTSGHGVCGLARLSPRSIVATAIFMATAILTVYLVHHVF